MADTSIGKAYVQIIPKAEGISGQIEDIISPAAEESGEKGGSSLGKSLLKGLAAAGALPCGRHGGDSPELREGVRFGEVRQGGSCLHRPEPTELSGACRLHHV